MAETRDCVVHFLAQKEDGPIVSGKDWTGTIRVSLGHDTRVGPIGGTHWAILCRPEMMTDQFHRASGEPWAVDCPECLEKLKAAGISCEVPGRIENEPVSKVASG